MRQEIEFTSHERKARLMKLVFEMKKKGIAIDFASHPCFSKFKHE